MGKEIRIKNFGQIKNVRIDVEKKIQLIIGQQASGKSTVCKVVYFCQKIRDYTLDYLTHKDFTNVYEEEFTNYLKYLTRQFMGTFGTTKHMSPFVIEYAFSGSQADITISLKDGYVRFRLKNDLAENIKSLIKEVRDVRLQQKKDNSRLLDDIKSEMLLRDRISQRLKELFKNNDEIIYVPAGRSMLATLSEQLQELPVSELDLTMQDFIDCIRKMKNRFGMKLPDMVKNYLKTVRGQINNQAVDLAYKCIKEILQADYKNDSDGEKIYYDTDRWIKLMYSSSGQQESLWILMLTFSKILDREHVFMVLEEPEAHLFPNAQKEITKMMALLVNATDSRIIITTHSPYILTSLNILLYSGKIEGNGGRTEQASVIPKSFRVSFHSFSAFRMSEGTIIKITDNDTHMVDTRYIDEISEITNEELEKLMEKGICHDMPKD